MTVLILSTMIAVIFASSLSRWGAIVHGTVHGTLEIVPWQPRFLNFILQKARKS